MTARPKLSNRISFALLVMLAGFTSAGAATLEEYRHRIAEAIVALQQLQLVGNHGDTSRVAESSNATIARLRNQLPAKETILLPGQTVAVDNSWLHEALNEYEKSSGRYSERTELLTRIGERLLAIGQRLDEAQPKTGAADKDQDKGRLAEILRRPEYNKTAAEGSAIGRLWERFLRWLASLFPKTRPMTPGSSRAISSIAQIVVIAISVAVIAFLIWKFVPRYLRNRSKKKPKREARIVLGERLEPDQTSADLLAQAEALARSGDLRAAIRKAYIAFLCELGDRKVVSLAQHKTNRDYLNAVREKASLHSSMRGLTQSFELHWYGFQPAGESDWDDFRKGYQRALNMS
jgi:hypothetical protein